MNQLEELLSCRGFSRGGLADGRFALSGSMPHYAPDRTLDTRHIRLEVALDFSRKALTGTCTTSLTALAEDVTSMVFDAVDFQKVRVRSIQRPVRHTYDKRQLKISWDKPLQRGKSIDIEIRYRVVKPKLGLHFIGPDRDYPNKPIQAWTQGEDEYNRFWFPCHDAPQERASSEMIVTVPARFTAVSNGALLKVRRNARTKTFHWKQTLPHPPYLISLAVGEFSLIRDRWRHVPVLYYCPPGREEDAKRAFGKTPKMLEFFSKALGVPYPYAKYSQVAAVDFIYGGMENISATTQTAQTLHDARAHLDFSSDPLVAHELAHQWFGDLVTCKDWSHAWLNESFATYFEALFKEHDLGPEEFAYELYENAQSYFDEDKNRYRRPLVTRTYKSANDLFDRHLYEKGSIILHMLRRLLGDRAFWRSMNLYLKRHRAQGVETVDLINAIQDATGRNMRPFFDQWVFKGGHPEYKVRTWWNAAQKKVYVRILQTQSVNDETGLFSMPATLAFYIGSSVKRFTETVDKKDHLFSYPLSQAPQLVLFDPDHSILKRVDFAKPESMWIFQLSHDPHVLGRLAAAQAVGHHGSPQAVRALSRALIVERFWGVQVEIARALGQAGSLVAQDALLDALRQIDHPKVRRALFESLGRYRSSRVSEEIQTLYGKEASYLVEAEGLRSLGRMKDSFLLPELKKTLEKDSWNDVLRSAALDGIAALQLPESIAILKAYTRRGHSSLARMAAIRGLGMVSSLDPESIQKNLIGLLQDPYLLVQLAVVRVLGSFGDERAAQALLSYTTGDRDGRLKRTAEEAIRRIRKGMENEFPAAKK